MQPGTDGAGANGTFMTAAVAICWLGVVWLGVQKFMGLTPDPRVVWCFQPAQRASRRQRKKQGHNIWTQEVQSSLCHAQDHRKLKVRKQRGSRVGDFHFVSPEDLPGQPLTKSWISADSRHISEQFSRHFFHQQVLELQKRNQGSIFRGC